MSPAFVPVFSDKEAKQNLKEIRQPKKHDKVAAVDRVVHELKDTRSKGIESRNTCKIEKINIQTEKVENPDNERLQGISIKKSTGSTNSRTSTRSTLTDQHEEGTKEFTAKADNTIEGTIQKIDRTIKGKKVAKSQPEEPKKCSFKKLGIPKPHVEITSHANEVIPKAIDHLSINQHTVKHDGHKRAASDTSVMTTLNLLQGNNDNNNMRIGWNSMMSIEREEALESLLELCAELLQHKNLEELAGVLKPFGEEGVSSRETAIWLTKGLMNLQNPSEEA